MGPKNLAIMAAMLLGANCFAAGSATVVVLRGSAKTADGKALVEKQKVDPGTTVVTGTRSFVRLLFADNTQLNIGPDTTMKIENAVAGQASLVDLVSGQIRAKVTKDPLIGQDGGPVKEKMVIKTKTAAMGIRGTDFNVSFNQQNNMTTLITFEGNVAMTKILAGADPVSALQQKVGVQSVGAGQFSGTQPEMAQATIPVKISPAQLESLKGNTDFQGLGEKGKKQDAMGSPMPPGVDPKGFSSGTEKSMKDSMAQSMGAANINTASTEAPAPKSAAPAEGFFNKATGEYAPRAGGFVDLASGRYVPPPSGSSFDANTGVFVPPLAMGSISANGMYLPPKGVDLDPVKGFIAEVKPVAVDGTRLPSGTTPPPPNALIVAMNDSVKPENSTKTVTLDGAFSAGGSAVNGGKTTTGLPPPPPPGTQLPPPNTDPVNTNPVSNNCATDNSCGGVNNTTTLPPNTNINFHINVTD